ncbi:MAG TPA: UbiA family prenyltransferase [Polyangiaceae bacterium]|nr:UbiA family prenyltransferase [Polyangiaceae bacterium]
MSLSLWLRLGRVSNLPTVWSNVLAGLALVGALEAEPSVLVAALALSIFYVGGMYLNDAFDRNIDRVERPTRPIPAGQVSARAVFTLGFAALAIGTALLGFIARANGASPLKAVGSALALSAFIVLYDAYHKQNPVSPLTMAACRVMIYVAVGFSARRELGAVVLLGVVCLACYLVGLTYAAKQEAFNRLPRLWPLACLGVPVLSGAALAARQPGVWPFLLLMSAWVVYALSYLRQGPRRAVPQAVVRLIAGISLLDAVLIAFMGASEWALVAASFCLLTRVFQRFIPGT